MSTLPQRPAAQPGDGLGYRVLGFDKKTGDRLEMLRVRPQFAGLAEFETALRDRLQRLSELRGTGFARVRQVDRLTGQASGIAIVSNHVEGQRLADLLQIAETHGVRVDIDAALCLLRQLVAAITNLHAAGPGISHGCIGPERLLVTPDARLIVTEYILGSALEAMQWPRERFWQDFRIALPAGADPATFDQRTDILQIGLVALALITGRSVYAEKTYPLPLAERVRNAKETPATGTPHPLGAALSAWLSRMLLLDPAKAFASMEEAQAALDELVSESYLAAPASVASFVERCREAAPDAARELAETTTTIITAASGDKPAKQRITQAFAQPYPAPATPAAATPAAGNGAQAKTGSPATGGIDAAKPAASATPVSPAAPARPGATATPAGKAASDAAKPAAASGSSGSGSAAPAAAAKSGAAAGADTARADGRQADSAKKPAAASAKPSLVIQPDAMIDDDTSLTSDVVIAQKRRVRKPLMVGLGLAVVIAAGFELMLRYANPFDGSPAQASSPAVMPATKGVLTIDASPKAAAVVVDDVARGTTPLKLELAAGAHNVRLDGGEGLTRTFSVTVTAGKEISHLVELSRNAETGSLDIKSDPAGARVMLDGKLVGMSPVTIADVDPGDHNITVEGPQGTVRQAVKVIAGTRASVVVPLNATPASAASVTGWLSVTADQEVQVSEGGQVLGSTRVDKIMMAAGTHELEFSNDTIGFSATRSVQVQPGKVTRLSIPLPDGTVSVNAAPWADVWLDGQAIGQTPVGNLAAKAGSHDLVFRHPKLGEKKQTVIVKPGQASRVTVDMSK
jgi:hypothetical protein